MKLNPYQRILEKSEFRENLGEKRISFPETGLTYNPETENSWLSFPVLFK